MTYSHSFSAGEPSSRSSCSPSVEALTSGHVSADASTLFSTVLGALIGAVATYLGSTYMRKENTVTTEDPQTPEPEPTEPAPEPDSDDTVTTLEDGEGEDVGPDSDG